MKRYVGIDPSTKTGFVVIGETGKLLKQFEIQTKEKSDPQRFMHIAKKIEDEIVWLPEHVIICIEGFAYGAKGKGVSTQYGIGWMIRAELVRNGFTYYDIPPSVVKKFATGKGNVKKDAMVLPIFKHWGFEHDSDNVRDAYVMAQIARGLNGEGTLLSYQKEVLEKIKGMGK